MEDKLTLRKRIQQLKKELSHEQQRDESQQVFTKLEQLEVFKTSKNILCYWSLPDELATQSFIKHWYKDKSIYLPKVVNKNLTIHRYEGMGSMQKGKYDILEPNTHFLKDLDVLDLIIVPGIAFTKAGERMGRGGGYYDRFLPQVPKAIRVGVAYNCQIVDDIPSESHDVNMSLVLTSGQ